MILLAGGLLLLLPLLAVMQYRWLTEVSQAEGERMKANLQVSASQFCQEFDREITQAYLNFQPASRLASLGSVVDAGSPPASLMEADLPASYRQWMEHAAHPRLVRAIYDIRVEGNGEFALSEFRPESGAFAPCDWPENLASLRESLARQRHEQRMAQSVLQEMLQVRERFLPPALGGNRALVPRQDVASPVSKVMDFSIGPTEESIPGLIIPVVLREFSRKAEAGRDETALPAFYRVIAFDVEYLRREFLPELVRRHFASGGEKSDFNVAIARDGDREHLVYSSNDAMSSSAFATGDVTESLFRVRLNQGDRMLVSRLPGIEELAKSVAEADGKGTRKRAVTSIIIRSQSGVSFGAAGDGNASASDGGKVALALHRDDRAWRVIVRHRAGSLEAAVAATHRRNLAISFGILLLMGISVGLIVMSSRRAQALAERQMEFVANVSHELRTPLAVICSAGENLADGVIGNTEQIQRYGGLIRDEGRRLSGMVEQVLEFAGAQAGRRAYELQPVALRAVLEDALSAVHLQAVEGGFDIESRMPASEVRIKADAAALSRAVQNLLANAMKYSGDSRWVGLAVEIGGADDGRAEARVRISDRGLGIAPRDLPHIFEPFYRGADVVAAQIHGNGLGLSLVRHIVEAHGGRVGVDSRPGEGARFTLHLPLLPDADPAASVSQQTYEQANSAR